jgi:predicted dienelactone hydrolase
MLSKFDNKSAQKSSIFPTKASYARGLMRLGMKKLLGLMITFLSIAMNLPANPVGIANIEYFDAAHNNRPMVMLMFYPAVLKDAVAKPFVFPFYKGIQVYKDAEPAFNEKKYPLVLLSHGRGGNRFHLAWLAAYLAANGYIVGSMDHAFADSYDSSYEYLASKIWQRPVDVSTNITYLLNDPKWSRYIDPSKIGVAGFSQGGFTALWVGGAKVNSEKFLTYQQNRKDDPVLPEYYKKNLPVDAKPAMNVEDKRVKAVFAMAPGVIQGFGFDENGLKQLTIPTYIIAGEKDSVVPILDNAKFAAKYIPNVKLTIIPGAHYMFLNECDAEGKSEFPDVCVDDPSVDRKKNHEFIEKEALKFFDASF